MANQKQLDVLKHGIMDTWMQWRGSHANVPIDLDEADLRSANLGGLDLSFAQLRSADLSLADANNANLSTGYHKSVPSLRSSLSTV